MPPFTLIGRDLPTVKAVGSPNKSDENNEQSINSTLDKMSRRAINSDAQQFQHVQQPTDTQQKVLDDEEPSGLMQSSTSTTKEHGGSADGGDSRNNDKM